MTIPIYSKGAAGKQYFYVPDFEVLVGTLAPTHLIDDIIDVRFNDDINAIDSFEITLNNWDAKEQKFKFEPPLKQYQDLFEPDHRIDLHMGYAGDLVLKSSGVITAIEPNYPESGGPTLTIRAQHKLHICDRRQYTRSWEKKRDSEVAQELGNSPANTSQPGLGIPVLIDENAKEQESTEKIVLFNKSVVEFLHERAKRRGYVFYVDTTDDGKDQIYFGPPDRPDRIEYELKWGQSLTSFRPTFAVARQVERVTVCGIDRETRRDIEESAVFPGDCALNPNLPPPKDSVEVITDPPARSIAEARSRARETLLNYRRTTIEASGATVGLPHLRAGSYITIGGLGDRFNGRYFVTKTTHSIGSGGYITSFNACREDTGRKA